MERKIHATVQDFFNAIAPLIDQPHRRVDDRGARLMGRAWDEKGVAHLISVADFKATGDIGLFRELWEKRFGKDRKPRPEPEPQGDDAPTVH